MQLVSIGNEVGAPQRGLDRRLGRCERCQGQCSVLCASYGHKGAAAGRDGAVAPECNARWETIVAGQSARHATRHDGGNDVAQGSVDDGLVAVHCSLLDGAARPESDGRVVAGSGLRLCAVTRQRFRTVAVRAGCRPWSARCGTIRSSPSGNQATRTACCLSLIFGPDMKAFAYAGGHSTLAAETWHNQRGDCLSLSIMSVALARALEVPVQIQEVRVPVAFDRRDGVDFLNQHVNVLVPNERELRAMNRTLPAGYIVVDFEPQVGARKKGEALADRSVLARFHNNRAAEHLARGQNPLAYAHFKVRHPRRPRLRGVLQQPGSAVPSRRLQRRRRAAAASRRGAQRPVRPRPVHAAPVAAVART